MRSKLGLDRGPWWSLAACLAFVSACTGPEPEPVLPETDTAAMEPAVQQAVERARAAVLESPDSATAWGELGMVCHVHGLHAAAIAAYHEAMKLDLEDVRWSYFRGEVLALEGADEEAVHHFRMALEQRPDYVPILMRLGDALTRQGESAGAESAYREALQLEPDFGPALLGLGQVLLQKGELEVATETLERAAELLPNSGTALFSLSRAYQRAGRPEEAARVAEAAAAATGVDFFQDPLMFEVISRGASLALLRNRAHAFLEAGEFEKALRLYERVIAREPDEADVHQDMAVAHQELGQVGEAIASLSEVVRLDPQRTAARIRLAILSLESGQAAVAIPHLRQAKAELPKDDEVPALLGRALLLTENAAAAVSEFELANRLSDGALAAWVHDEWGNALAQTGRIDEALPHFRTAVSEEPDNARANLNLGLALEAIGRLGEAVSHYQKAWENERLPLAGARLEALRPTSP